MYAIQVGDPMSYTKGVSGVREPEGRYIFAQ